MRSFFDRVLMLSAFSVVAVAFLLLPVGGKTSAERLGEILRTRPAREAASAFAEMARVLAQRVAVEAERLHDGQSEDGDAAAPSARPGARGPASSATPRPGSRDSTSQRRDGVPGRGGR